MTQVSHRTFHQFSLNQTIVLIKLYSYKNHTFEFGVFKIMRNFSKFVRHFWVIIIHAKISLYFDL